MKRKNTIRHKIYLLILFFITLSGFAQMPIFKRYYIADIPGFGWLAQFYITHMMHYIFAGVFITFVCYVFFDFFLNRTDSKKISKTGFIKIISIAGLIITGGFLIVKNLSGIYLGHTLIIVLDIFHLVLCMFLLVVSFYSMVKKKKWLV